MWTMTRTVCCDVQWGRVVLRRQRHILQGVWHRCLWKFCTALDLPVPRGHQLQLRLFVL
jgi:hypothetical protein